ncbi:hypothetical protein [Nodosilinea sp. E11]|uniref:nSTAND1 domain-containing NTPase n=1 Tax=Nodosilinea sp. E11 TaxID=3037479 RepID=UPI0029344E1C|nr:hypothetical protein [Nodosilinea sp. E11]WOD39956.1 hypothetical protein RRF56_04035 [Nodosilinea sp. E11]
MPDVSPSEIDRHNQQALDELCRLLRFSQGEFELILAVCNSTQQRHELVEQLRQQCSVAFAEMTLDPSTTTLFTTVRNAIGSPPPEALMVYGLDGVHDRRQLLTATNQIREEFRQFPFPLVLWLTDDGLKQLIRTAPDFYTWANSVTFATPPEFFLAFLDQLIADVGRQVVESRENRFLSNQELGLTPGSARCQELETSLAALAEHNIALTPAQAAALEFVQGRIADHNTPAAREHYERSLAQWQVLLSQNGSAESIAQWQENVGHGQFYLGLWWRNYSVRHRREFEPACQQACRYFEQAVQTFDQAQRPELIARYINYWAEALHRLEAWEPLETVAARARLLHQAQANPVRQARAEGFLAEVDLAHENYGAAQRHAEAALALIQPVADSHAETSAADRDFYAWVHSFHRSWYVFSLGKAQMGQGQVDAAVQTLEQVQRITQPEYDPQLYSQTLEYLRRGYFEQGHYLQAFETRREKEAIESRFNFRAFVGAGRLQPKQQITNPALPTGDHGPDLIMASGRKHDVQRLTTRLEQDEFVLTVVYGPSGVGKSSLIEAGLVPTLEQQRFGGRQVVPVRLWSYSNWVEDLLATLPSWEGPGVGQTLDAENATDTEDLPTPPFGHPSQEGTGDDFPLLGGARGGSAQSLPTPINLSVQPEHPSEEGMVLDRLRRQTQRNRAIVLIFDQFEEFFFACDQPADRLRFYRFLGDCLTMPFIKVVLSLREDYTHYLLECNRLTDLAIIDNNILDKKWIYYLGNFSPDDARGVINDLTQPTPYAPAPDLVERVVADLGAEAGEVRPIELQIVGSQLQAEGIDTLAAYQGWPHTETSIKAALVQQYLNDVVQDCGPVTHHQQLANLVLYLLTDDKGTRPRKSKSELANELQALTAQAAVDVAPFGLVLQVLTESGLVVQLPEAPEDRYQLVHDYLAAFIHQQQTPQLEALMAELEEEKRQRRLAEAEKEELAVANQKARRRLLFSSGLLAASLVGVLIAVPSAISALRVARAANAQADQAQQDVEGARQAQAEADLAREEADKAAKEAVERQRQADQAAKEALEQVKLAQAAVEAAKNAEGIAVEQQQAAQQQAAAAQKAATAAEQLRASAAQEAQAAAVQAKAAARQQQIAREGTQLEQRGNALLRLGDIRFRQAAGLIEALQIGYELKSKLPEANAKSSLATLANYPAYSPLLALRVTTNTLTEGGSYEGFFLGFTPDEQGLVTDSNSDGKSRLWSLSGTEQASYEGVFLGFTPDEQGLVTDSNSDGKSRLWSLSGTEQASYEGVFLGFTPDEQGLVTVSYSDGKSRLWSLSGTEQASYEGVFLGFTPDEQGLVTDSNSDGKSRLWSLSGTEQASYEGVFLGFTPDEQGLVTDSNSDGKSRLWSLSGTEQASYEGVFLGFTPDEQGLVTVSYSDGKSRLWSLSGTEQASYEGVFLGFTPDEQGLVTDSNSDGKSRLWSLSGTEQASYEGVFLGFTPDEQGLVTDSNSDGKSRLWSLSGTEQASYEGVFLGFTPDEQGLVTDSNSDGKSRLWSLSGTEQASYEGVFLGFTPDEQGLVTDSNSDGKSRLWSLSGTEQASYEGVFRGFTPDEQGLYTDSEYGTTTLWNLAGELLAEFTGRMTTNFDKDFDRFSDDGQYLITSLDNTTHRIWRLDNGLDDLLARGCNLLESYFTANPGQREALGICLE